MRSPKGRKLLVVLGLWLGCVVLCGALPGEMRGCDTDLSDEVNHFNYCKEKCTAICGRMIDCGLYEMDRELEADETANEVCQAECEAYWGCDSTRLCTDPEAYISHREATRCLEDWDHLGCTYVTAFPYCAPLFFGDAELCPRPNSCEPEALCDPPEWE